MFKQAAALGLKKQIITTGGSQNPDQLIDQAGTAVNGTMHLTTFAPWNARGVARSGSDQEPSSRSGRNAAIQFAGVTESFRGYDGIRTIAAAIHKAGKAEPEAIRAALWQLEHHRPERQDQVHEGRAGRNRKAVRASRPCI